MIGTMPLDQEEVRRRIKAAIAYRGLSGKRLADRINESGLGKDTISHITAGRRQVQHSELSAIASACDMPLAFFTEDFSRLGSATLTDERLDRLEAMLSQLRADAAGARIQEWEEALAQEEAAIRNRRRGGDTGVGNGRA